MDINDFLKYFVVHLGGPPAGRQNRSWRLSGRHGCDPSVPKASEQTDGRMDSHQG